MVADVRAPDEQARLSAVRRYDILDTPPDGAFERITALAARLLDVPIAIVSIVDTDRIWFKSHHGLEVDQIGREPGLCASAIMQDEPWIVTDASVDPRTLTNSLVAGSFGLRFYAGVPLQTADGHNLGTLCVIDRQPRPITSEEIDTLRDLAAVVLDELELRLASLRTVDLQQQLRHSAEELARALQESLLPRELPSVETAEIASRYHAAFRDQVGGDFYDVVPDADGFIATVGDVCGKGAHAAAMTGTVRWTMRTLSRDTPDPAEQLGRLNDVVLGVGTNPDRYCTIACARFRPRAGGGLDASVALGGHPRPFVIRAGGAIEMIGGAGPLVGWSGDVSFSEESTALAPGDQMLLYTDGLLDAPTTGGEEGLRAALGPCAGESAEATATALDRLLGDGPFRDDTAFLVVRAK